VNFQLNDSQQKLVSMVRDFCVREVSARDRVGSEERFPREVVQQLGELGLLGMTVPEEMAGRARRAFDRRSVEEIARWDGSLRSRSLRTTARHFAPLAIRQRRAQAAVHSDIAAGRKLAAWD